ncbi:MAG: prepilin-type N-terminal cleavage/methylation domain-containing protein [Desulfobacteraceae bacterium]|jgi:type IV pilus assembly protein PilW|nr:MAG: prepilin-type N-terminal cleavage/methylation domain-containing protein [Desulfobacteraceae bacterium]
MIKTSYIKGFTLIELLVAIVIAGLVAGAMYASYRSQQDSYVAQQELASLQQNLRAALFYMEREIRLAGYDPRESGNFGITDIRLRDLNDNLDANGNSSIEFTIDRPPEDGIIGPGDETIYYSIFDNPVATPDGNLDLARRVGPRVGGGGRQLLAQNIIALGLAYAFDNDGNKVPDATPAGNIIWAIDSNNDNSLDLSLDTNDDGNIDTQDNPAGVPLVSPVTVDKIIAVRIWLLARGTTQDPSHTDNTTYVVGHRRITPNNGFRHRLFSSIVKCRNLLL